MPLYRRKLTFQAVDDFFSLLFWLENFRKRELILYNRDAFREFEFFISTDSIVFAISEHNRGT